MTYNVFSGTLNPTQSINHCHPMYMHDVGNPTLVEVGEMLVDFTGSVEWQSCTESSFS